MQTMNAMDRNTIHIHTNIKHWVVGKDRELLHLSRIDERPSVIETIDTFAESWLLAWVEGTSAGISVRSRDRFILLRSSQYIFLPPFSLIHWRVLPGFLKWNAIVSRLPLPNGIPKVPAVYDRTQSDLPRTYKELCDLLESKVPQLQVIQERTRSTLAPAVRAHLNQTYRDKQSIQELADQFGIGRVSLTRSFKNAYYLSPMEYRQRLRIEHALFRIAQGNLVELALAEGGFTSVSEFYRQVQELHGFSPGKISPRSVSNSAIMPDLCFGG